MNGWSNLAGPPNRYSTAISAHGRARREHDGLIKIRLAHSLGRSYLIPDVLIGVCEARYLIPSFFSPPTIAFNVEPDLHLADFSINVGAPRATKLERLLVRVSSHDRVRTYEDGARVEAKRGF